MIFVAFRSCGDNTDSRHKSAYNLCEEMLKNLGIYSDIKKDHRGKPYTDGALISISHSGGVVCCAVSVEGAVKMAPSFNECFVYNENPKMLGVDIERLDLCRNTEKIANRFFSKGEREKMLSLGQHSFYTVYTRKEAYLKATGDGIAKMRSTDITEVGGEFESRVIEVSNAPYVFSLYYN